jgi:hypothetical protein
MLRATYLSSMVRSYACKAQRVATDHASTGVEGVRLVAVRSQPCDVLNLHER